MSDILYEARPAVFKSHIFLTVIGLILSLVGVGLIIIIPLWISSKSKKLTIRKNDIQLTEGILSKETNEVPLDSITNIRTKQGFFERLLNVGEICISTSATSGREMVITEFSNPDLITDIIKENKQWQD